MEMTTKKHTKGLKASILFEGDPPVNVSVDSVLSVIERWKLKTDRNGNFRITPEMIAEAKALDLAKGDPGLSLEEMKEALDPTSKRWVHVEDIEDLERETEH
jgi:hypothetical protein